MTRPFVISSDGTSGLRRVRSLLFSGCRIEDVLHFGDAVRGEAPPRRVLPNHLLVRRDVDAVDDVAGDVAVHPLDARAERVQYFVRFLRDAAELLRPPAAAAGNLTFDDVLGHV